MPSTSGGLPLARAAPVFGQLAERPNAPGSNPGGRATPGSSVRIAHCPPVLRISIAQLAERRSPKPKVQGSTPCGDATTFHDPDRCSSGPRARVGNAMVAAMRHESSNLSRSASLHGADCRADRVCGPSQGELTCGPTARPRTEVGPPRSTTSTIAVPTCQGMLGALAPRPCDMRPVSEAVSHIAALTKSSEARTLIGEIDFLAPVAQLDQSTCLRSRASHVRVVPGAPPQPPSAHARVAQSDRAGSSYEPGR